MVIRCTTQKKVNVAESLKAYFLLDKNIINRQIIYISVPRKYMLFISSVDWKLGEQSVNPTEMKCNSSKCEALTLYLKESIM